MSVRGPGYVVKTKDGEYLVVLGKQRVWFPCLHCAERMDREEAHQIAHQGGRYGGRPARKVILVKS